MIDKFKKTEAYHIEYHELEEIICAEYGIEDYNIAMIMETSNDTVVSVNTEEEKLDVWEEDTLKEVRAGKEPIYSLDTVMKDLCNKGLVPKGQIYVNICW